MNSAVWYASPRVGRRVCRKERSLHNVRLRERKLQAIFAAISLPLERMVDVVDDNSCAASAAGERILASSAGAVLLVQEPATLSRMLSSPHADFWYPAECKEVAIHQQSRV